MAYMVYIDVLRRDENMYYLFCKYILYRLYRYINCKCLDSESYINIHSISFQITYNI